MQNLRKVGKDDGPILSRLWTKVHEVLGQRTFEHPGRLSMYVSFRRYLPLSLQLVEEPNKCKRSLAPNSFARYDPDQCYFRFDLFFSFSFSFSFSFANYFLVLVSFSFWSIFFILVSVLPTTKEYQTC